MGKIAVIRLRGSINTKKEIRDTFKLLGLKRVNSLIIVDSEDKSKMGMIKKVKDFVTWGELSEETENLIKEKKGADKKVYRLSPARGGIKGIKRNWPKGSIGYRGEKINDLIRKML